MLRFLALFLSGLGLFTGSSAFAQINPGGFEKLKALAGTWQAKGPDGMAFDITYEIRSGGFSVIETRHGTGENMVSVFHVDGDSLLMTHYCAVGNQPRMRAKVPAGEVASLTFGFVDVSNLTSPEDGHMHGLVLTFHDNNRVTQTWTWRQQGADRDAVFELTRKQ